jgi:hypothetical protein
VKKYLFFIFSILIALVILFLFLSSPKITVAIKSPANFTITDFLGDINLTRDGKEISLKEIPFILEPKDEININPFSGLTILCKNSTLLLFHPSTNFSIGDNFINLNSGYLEWKKGRAGTEIHFKNGFILYPSEAGSVNVESKITIISLKGISKLKTNEKEESIEELKKLTIDSGKLTLESVEKPPVILSPKNGEVYGDWKKDFGTFNFSIEYSGYEQFQLEVSPDPYFLSTIFSVFFKEKDSKIPLERIGTGRRFARVIPYKGRVSGIPSESVEFFVKAFPLSNISAKGIPPRIDIYSVILSGNIVIVKGKVDRGCKLFVNKEEVSPEPNGEFNVPITFNDIGEKWIEIEAISSSGIRSSKRQRVFLVGY